MAEERLACVLEFIREERDVMSHEEERLEQLAARLRQERDELRVRAHLLKAELRDEWDELERKWHKLEPRLSRLREGSRESAEDIGAAAQQLGEELIHAYKRLRQAVK